MTGNQKELFQTLCGVMKPYAERLVVKPQSNGDLYLDTRHHMKNGKPLFFGAVHVLKLKVSYHLMPVYVNPSLLDGISPALRKKMSGKSCFQFATIDPDLTRELSRLTRLGFDDYRKQGFIE